MKSGHETGAVVINGKTYWGHVVELAKFYRKMKREAKSRDEEKRIDEKIKRSCKMYRSLGEVLSYGEILDGILL